MSVARRPLGRTGLVSSSIGLGCMGMTYAYDSAAARDEAEAVEVIRHALDIGVTMLDTADMYGPATNELLVGRAIRGRRDEALVATKFGFETLEGGGQRINGRPDYVLSACDASLARLGVDHIDLYYQHRVDAEVPIEETVGAMAQLVAAGKVRHIGLSEPGAATLRRAHAAHPIAAVQSEYSLFARDIEAEVLPACRELGIGLVAYSPLGRGMLTGRIRAVDDLAPEDSRRRRFPRFAAENLAANVALARRVEEAAARRGVSAAQLALAWVRHQGDDVVPIPGTKRLARLEENVASAAIELSDAEAEALAGAVPADAIAGTRHYDMAAIGR